MANTTVPRRPDPALAAAARLSHRLPPVVYLALAVSSLPVAILVAGIGPRWVIGGALALLAILTTWGAWPHTGLWVLILAAGVNRFALTIGGLSLYAEYLALALVGLLFAADLAAGRRQWRWPAGAWPLLGWLIIGLAASLMHAPHVANSLVLWTKLLLVTAIYALAANLVSPSPTPSLSGFPNGSAALRAFWPRRAPVQPAAGEPPRSPAQAKPASNTAIGVQLAVGSGVAAWGLLAIIVWQRLRLDLGLFFKSNGSIVPTGSQWEPNIYGSYCLAVALLALPAALTRTPLPARNRLLTWLAFGLGFAGLLASLTRAAWLGFALAILLSLLTLAWRQPLPTLAAGAGLGLIGLSLIAILAWSDVRFLLPQAASLADLSSGGALAQRLGTFTDLANDGNIWVRQQVLQHALHVWQEHVWIGWGIGAYSQVYYYPNANATSWIPNLFVHQLYNTGLLGLGCFCWALGLVIWNGLLAWRRAHGERRAHLAGLLLALTGLLTAFQATEASWLAYFWLFLALLEGTAHEALPHDAR